MLGNLLAFILLIGPLIFIHELGHLIAAKLVDVKVDRFSIGLGPAVFKVRLGETDYVVTPFPLGGYVSMLGQNSGSDAEARDSDRSLANKPLWARYLVLSAGPLANLALPVVVYFFYFVINHTLVTPAIIGTVVPGSAAELAGLRQGDRIVSIEGRDVRSWSEMRKRISSAPGEELAIQIDRDGRRLDRAVTPTKVFSRNAVDIKEEHGRLGVLSIFYAPQIGISDPQSPAYQEGLRTGDVITSVNGEPIETLEELEQVLSLEHQRDALLRLTYLRPSPVSAGLGTLLTYESHHAQLLPYKSGAESSTGILPARAFVRAVDPDSPAARAGMKAGDRILAVDGEPFTQWFLIEESFASDRKRAIRFEVQSPGQDPRDVWLTLGTLTWKDRYDQDRSIPWLGLHPFQKYDQADPEPLRGRLSYALWASVDQTLEATRMTWTALVQMLTFERSVEELSSIVGLYKVAGRAYETGPGEFLRLLATLSVNLGVINFLPIPILDGGHLMFFTIEAVRRRPLSQRAREITSAIGLFIIVILLFIATRNDFLRHWL